MNITPQQFEQTLKALQYIEDHLTDPICIEDISRHVNYSLFHFSRVFNAVCMISPYTYLMRRRITEAANQVINSRRRLTDIALDYGFQSSEVFSRSFRRLFNAAPTELRKDQYIDSRLLLPPVTENQLKKWQHFRNIRMQKDEWQPCTASGLLTRSTNPGTTIKQEWQEMNQQYAPGQNQPCLSILYFPKQWESKGNYLFSGFHYEQQPEDQPPWFVQRQISAQIAISTKSILTVEDVPAYLAYLSAVWFPISSYQPLFPYAICLFQKGLTSVKLYLAVHNKEDMYAQ
jgi:AraC family transcriptional regulator